MTVKENGQKRLFQRASWSCARAADSKPGKRAANCRRRMKCVAGSPKNAFPSLCRFIRGRSRMPPARRVPKSGRVTAVIQQHSARVRFCSDFFLMSKNVKQGVTKVVHTQSTSSSKAFYDPEPNSRNKWHLYRFFFTLALYSLCTLALQLLCSSLL